MCMRNFHVNDISMFPDTGQDRVIRMILSQRLLPLSLRLSLRTFTSLTSCRNPSSSSRKVLADTSLVSDVCQVNSRLENLRLTAQFLADKPLLQLPTAVTSQPVKCPTLESINVKRFIVEETKKVVGEPVKHVVKIEDPKARGGAVEKHCIRMIVLRRIKMNKHKRKKLWKRMGLRFRADTQQREKRKELIFRAKLASKVGHEKCGFPAASYEAVYE